MTILHDFIFVWSNLFWCLKEMILGWITVFYLFFLVVFPPVATVALILAVLSTIEYTKKRG